MKLTLYHSVVFVVTVLLSIVVVMLAEAWREALKPKPKPQPIVVTVVIDGCEYLKVEPDSSILCHKGNCTNSIHQR